MRLSRSNMNQEDYLSGEIEIPVEVESLSPHTEALDFLLEVQEGLTAHAFSDYTSAQVQKVMVDSTLAYNRLNENAKCAFFDLKNDQTFAAFNAYLTRIWLPLAELQKAKEDWENLARALPPNQEEGNFSNK